MEQSPFVILTGASGAGKTSIAQAIEDEFTDVIVYQGDRIGCPSEEILASFGPAALPGGVVQRGCALHWIGVIAPTLSTGRPVLLEASWRIAFIEEALRRYGVSHARVILVHCDHEVRDARLIHNRRQPELADDIMRGWSEYLHGEAVDAGFEVLDTTNVPLLESVTHIASYLV